MTKLQTNLLLMLLAGILGALVFLTVRDGSAPKSAAGTPTTAAADDPREAVPLNPAQYDFGLAQMRGLLQTIAALDAGEIEGDNEAMAEAALAQAPGQGGNHPKGFHEALPPGFRQMSKSMRLSFAKMSETARTGDMAGYRTHRLEALQTCVACHESYRFERNAQ